VSLVCLIVSCDIPDDIVLFCDSDDTLIIPHPTPSTSTLGTEPSHSRVSHNYHSVSQSVKGRL